MLGRRAGRSDRIEPKETKETKKRKGWQMREINGLRMTRSGSWASAGCLGGCVPERRIWSGSPPLPMPSWASWRTGVATPDTRHCWPRASILEKGYHLGCECQVVFIRTGIEKRRGKDEATDFT